METFQSISINAPTCRVTICEGAEFGLEYKLSSAWSIVDMGVRAGAFTFTCRHRWPAALLFWNNIDNYIKVTYPAGARMERVALRNVSGRMEIIGLNVGQLTVETTSGPIQMSGVSADEIQIRQTSGGVRMENAGAGRITGSGVSGSFHAVGLKTGGVEYSTTSGGISLAGELAGNVDLSTVSGKVEANNTLPEEGFSYELRSVSGRRTVNGEPAASHIVPGAPYRLRVKTTSGGIRVRFAEKKTIV